MSNGDGCENFLETFWNKYMKSINHKIRKCKFHTTSASQHTKKIIYFNDVDAASGDGGGTNTDSYTNLAFELCLVDSEVNLIIFDFDARDKSKQSDLFNNERIQRILNFFDFAYIEKTFNNGLHVFIKTSQQFKIQNELIKIDNSLVIEVKQKVLIAPSFGYESIHIPSDLNKLTSLETVFGALKACFEFSQSCNELISKWIIPTKKINNPLEQLMIDQRAKRDQQTRGGGGEEPTSSSTRQKKPSSDNTTPQANSIEQSQDKKIIEDIYSNCLSCCLNTVSIKLDRLQKAKDMVAFIKEQQQAPNNNTSSSSSNLISHLYEIITTDDDQIEYRFLNEEECEIVSGVASKIEQISKLADYMCTSFMYNLNTSIAEFQKQIFSDKSPELYFSSVECFLENMIHADKCQMDDLIVNDQNDHITSVFATLDSFLKWKPWIDQYCKIVVNLKRTEYELVNKPTTSTSRQTNTDEYYYSVYRRVTMLNKCGHNLPEQRALEEYNRVIDAVRNGKRGYNFNSKRLFFLFVLKTLAVIELNEYSCTQFQEFVKFYTYQSNQNRLFPYTIRQMLKVKLVRIPHQFSSISDDSHQGLIKTTTLMYINKLPWIKTTDDYFITILTTIFFPQMNDTNCEMFIKSLRKLSRTEPRNFCKWSCMLPFVNGVFDFMFDMDQLKAKTICNVDYVDLNQDLTTLKSEFFQQSSSMKRKAAQIVDIIDEPSPNNFVKNIKTGNNHAKSSRKGVFSYDYYQYHEQIKTADCRKNYFDGRILKESTDINYHGFTIFRNYTEYDQVVEPIRQMFNIESYLLDFDTTNLLSIDNTQRYSPEFCYYMRSLFGDSPESGLMHPFHLQNFVCTMCTIAFGILREKKCQNCLVVQGTGLNGKSVFIQLVKEVFHNLSQFIDAKNYFNGQDINMQVDNVEETILLADTETKEMHASSFKKEIADSVPTKKRGLYKNLRDQESRAFFIFGTNCGLKFPKDKDSNLVYDYAFDRRIFLIKFYNFVGETLSNIESIAGANLLAKFSSTDNNNTDEMNTFMAEQKQKLEQEREHLREKTSIFQRKGFNLQNQHTCNKIKLGILYYLLDLIHVFDLPSMPKATYMRPSKVNARELAANNFDIVRTILTKFTCVSELVYNYTDIPNKLPQTCYRLDKMLSSSNSNNNNFKKEDDNKKNEINLMSLSNTLNELGFNVKVSSASNIEDTSSLNYATFDFTADKQYHVFYAYGLKLNDELTNEEVTIKSNPNKSHVCECLNDQSKYKNAQEFVNSHIRLDHRIEIIDGGIFSESMYSVLKKLILSEKVSARLKPKIDNSWRDIIKNDFLDNYKFHLFFE